MLLKRSWISGGLVALFLLAFLPVTRAADLSANIYASKLSGAAPLSVSFDARGSIGNISHYDWDFDDGGSATGSLASHTFTSDGDYAVELTVSDIYGNSDTARVYVSVSNSGLSAYFTASVWRGAAPLSVTFDASASTGPIQDYVWRVEDSYDSGSPVTKRGKTMSYTFDEVGTYDIVLKVIDRNGRSAEYIKTVEVISKGEADILAARFYIRYTECYYANSFKVRFDASPSSGDIREYKWNFDDGQSGLGETTYHDYSNASRDFNVKLTVTDSAGKKAELLRRVSRAECDEDYVDENDYDDDYYYDDDDYSYSGSTSSTSPNVHAQFRIFPRNQGVIPYKVDFDASSSTGYVKKYTWDFGDGSATADGRYVSHTYDSRPGEFKVRLTVEDYDGRKSWREQKIKVTGASDYLKATIKTDLPIEVNKTIKGRSPLTINFDASDSYGDIISYKWDFGDGSRQVTQPKVEKTFNSVGVAKVKLTVEDRYGRTSSDYLTVESYSYTFDSGEKDAISYTVNRGIMSYYPDGQFHREYNVTRAELLKVALKSASRQTIKDLPAVFRDVVGHWAKDYVNTAKQYSIVDGKDGQFYPDRLTTRAEALKMLLKSNFLCQNALYDEWQFPDTTEHWARNLIECARTKGIATGFANGYYFPDRLITREEIANMVYQIFQYYKEDQEKY